MRRIITILLAVGLLLCRDAAAQQSCKHNFSLCMFGELNGVAYFPAGASCYGGESFFCTPCSVVTNACSPAPECASCNKVAQPIDLATGNTDIAQADVRIPGLAGGLTVVRTWNSVWPLVESVSRIGMFGPNWRSTYE